MRVKHLHIRIILLIYSNKTSSHEEVQGKNGLVLFIIKTYKHLQFKFLKMACLLWLFLIYFCLELEIIIALGNLRQLSFNFYKKGISWQWKLILPSSKNLEKHTYRIETKIFYKIYQIIATFTFRTGFVKLTLTV